MEGGARACALRVAVLCDARVEAGARGLAAGRARASCVMGLRTFYYDFTVFAIAVGDYGRYPYSINIWQINTAQYGDRPSRQK